MIRMRAPAGRAGLALSFAVIAVCACTMLGPDFREPDVDWLADWQSDLYGQLGDPQQQTELDLRFWWTLFNDPVLDGLIETARRTNPSLRIAALRIFESRAALGIAGSTLYPQVQQIGGAIDAVRLRQHGGRTSDRDQDFVGYEAGFSVGWELDFWGRFRRGIESADAAFLGSIAAHQDVQVLLSAQVADLYFAYRTTLLRIGIARGNADIQKRSLEITRYIFESGQGSELDLQQARTQYLATLSTIPDLEITLTELRNALCAVLARAPGDLQELAGADAALPVMDDVMIREMPAALVLRRPDVRSAAWQVAAQSAQIGVARADYYPAISLFGSIGWSGNTLGASPDTGTMALGPSFSWNVFDYGRIRNNVRLQDARLQQAIEAFQNVVLQAAREIDDAAIGVIKTAEQRAVLAEALQAAERSLEIATTRYQEGYADFQRVLDAQRVLFAQADGELLARAGHVSAVIGFYKAIGGGWLDVSVERLIPENTRETMGTRTAWGDLLTAPLPEATHPGNESGPMHE